MSTYYCVTDNQTGSCEFYCASCYATEQVYPYDTVTTCSETYDEGVARVCYACSVTLGKDAAAYDAHIAAIEAEYNDAIDARWGRHMTMRRDPIDGYEYDAHYTDDLECAAADGSLSPEECGCDVCHARLCGRADDLHDKMKDEERT